MASEVRLGDEGGTEASHIYCDASTYGSCCSEGTGGRAYTGSQALEPGGGLPTPKTHNVLNTSSRVIISNDPPVTPDFHKGISMIGVSSPPP